MSSGAILQGQNFQAASQWQTSQNQHFKQSGEHSSRRVNAIAVLLFATCCAGIAAFFLYPYRDSESPAVYGQEGMGAFSLTALAAALGVLRRPQQQTVNRLFSETLIPVPQVSSDLVVTKGRGRRDACTSPAETVAIGSPLSLTTSFITYSIAQGSDGQFLQTWATSTGVSWREINSNYISGSITNQNFLTAGGSGGGPADQKVTVAPISGGGYFVLTTYAPYNGIHYFIDVWVLNASGGLISSSTQASWASGSGTSVSNSVTALSSGKMIVVDYRSTGTTTTLLYRVYSGSTGTSQANAFTFDPSSVTNALVATAAVPTSSTQCAIFWSYGGSLYGSIMDSSGNAQISKTSLLSISTVGLSCEYLSNGNVVVAWINSSTYKAEFKIFSVGSSFNSVTGVIEVDACTPNGQYLLAVKKLRDGFYITLTTDAGQVLGYYFGPTGGIVNGKAVLYSNANFFKSIPVIASLGTSQLYIATTLDGNTLLSTPFQINTAPSLVNPIQSPQMANATALYSLNLSNVFLDPDVVWGDVLSYNLTGAPSWLVVNSTSFQLLGVPSRFDHGTSNITLSVSDSVGAIASDQFQLIVPNVSPYVNGTILAQQVYVGSPWNLTVTGDFSDPEGYPLTFTATSGPYTFTNGTFSWTPVSGNQGSYSVSVTANDGYGGSASTTFTLTVPDRPPILVNPISAQRVHLGNLFSFAVPNGTFVDPDGDSISYNATLFNGNALPSWLQLASTGFFSGTPKTADEGVISVQLNGNDPYQGTASNLFSITAYNNAPQLSVTTPNQNATLTIPFNFILPSNTFIDPDGDPVTLTVGSLPSWLSFNPATGTFSGTPSIAGGVGNIPIQVIGTDPFAKSASESFAIQVKSSPPAIIYYPSRLQATPSSAFFFPVTTVFSDGTGFSLTYSVSGLPGWVIFENNILLGTPQAGDVGSTTFTLTATDQFGAEAIVQIPLMVSTGGGSNSLAVGSPILDITRAAGVPFTYAIPSNAFIDGPGNLISILSTFGDGSSLPTWFSFDGNRTYTGNPQVSNEGSYNILVRAFDQLGATAIQTFSLTINSPSNLPPAILSPPSDLVAFTTQLFNQYVGGVFAAPVNLSAEFNPDTWLKLQGQYLTGTPWYTDSAVQVILNGTSPEGATASVTFKVTLQGQTAGTLAVSIIFPLLGALGTLLTLYRYREWFKEKLVVCLNAVRRGGGSGVKMSSSSDIIMDPMNSAITFEAYVGAPFYQKIDLSQNPLLKNAEKYMIVGETRIVDQKTTNRLPDWVTGVKVDMKTRTVILDGTPQEASIGLNKINIVGYHGGRPSYYKVLVDVKHLEDMGRSDALFNLV